MRSATRRLPATWKCFQTSGTMRGAYPDESNFSILFDAVPEFILRDCPVLDAVVKGEGEHTFFELIESVREGNEIASVSGVCYVDKEGTFHDNGALPRIRTIDDIPRPYWPESYLEKFWAAGKSHGVLTEREP